MAPNGGNLQQAKRRAFGSRVSCSWSWEPAMLIGGILSATDPVAVVALLKELGVKKSLATLIEAESLLNDGTAVVVYSILLKAVQAGGLAAWTRWVTTSSLFEWHIIWTMTRMSILGPLFGIICGMLAVRWLQANAGADRDANVEVICSLALPFAIFYMAETGFGEYMQMSGVLAVVCFGLVFASPYGQSRIDPRVVHFLHEFWGMVGHLINTFLFTLSGCIIVLSIDPRSSTFGTDFGIAFAMYVDLPPGPKHRP
jgi:NhaP-type Na+/H+ or K+/H+ antiporter